MCMCVRVCTRVSSCVRVYLYVYVCMLYVRVHYCTLYGRVYSTAHTCHVTHCTHLPRDSFRDHFGFRVQCLLLHTQAHTHKPPACTHRHTHTNHLPAHTHTNHTCHMTASVAISRNASQVATSFPFNTRSTCVFVGGGVSLCVCRGGGVKPLLQFTWFPFNICVCVCE